MASDIRISAGNAIKVTLLVAVTAFVLRQISSATGVGRGLTTYLP